MYNTSGNRQNRRCDIPLYFANDPYWKCTVTDVSKIKQDVKQIYNETNGCSCKVQTVAGQNASARLQESSFYCVANAFWRAPWVLRSSNILKNTPTDYLHAPMLGVMKYAAKEVVKTLNERGRRNIDRWASKNLKRIRNGESVPRLNFFGGFTNLSKLNGQEIVGFLWGVLAMLVSDRHESSFQPLITAISVNFPKHMRQLSDRNTAYRTEETFHPGIYLASRPSKEQLI